MTRRGYSPAQVDDYLRYLDTQILMLSADRDALIEQRDQLARRATRERGENDRLRRQLRSLAASPRSAEGLSGKLRVILELAVAEAAELRERARGDARAVVARAEIEQRRAEQLRRRLEQDRDQLDAERAGMRRLEAQAADERARIEHDFAAAMASRRAEALAAIEQKMAHSRAEADQLLARARVQADRVIAQARHTAAALTSAAADRNVAADRLLGEARAQAGRVIEQRRAEVDRFLADARAHARRVTAQARRGVAEPSGQQPARPAAVLPLPLPRQPESVGAPPASLPGDATRPGADR